MRPPSSSTLVVMAILIVAASGCALLQHYDEGISFAERLEECRLLDRKVTEAGQLNAIGTFLAGGSGLAAGVKSGNSEALGYISAASGLFGALAAFVHSRHSERFAERHCDAVLNIDTTNDTFRAARDSALKTPYLLDTLRQGRDRVRARQQP